MYVKVGKEQVNKPQHHRCMFGSPTCRCGSPIWLLHNLLLIGTPIKRLMNCTAHQYIPYHCPSFIISSQGLSSYLIIPILYYATILNVYNNHMYISCTYSYHIYIYIHTCTYIYIYIWYVVITYIVLSTVGWTPAFSTIFITRPEECQRQLHRLIAPSTPEIALARQPVESWGCISFGAIDYDIDLENIPVLVSMIF